MFERAREREQMRADHSPKRTVFPSTSMSQHRNASKQTKSERFRFLTSFTLPSLLVLALIITTMKIISALIVAAVTAQSSAFVVPSTGSSAVASSTSMQMGLLDFFSEDARKEREARKQAEIEEQERLQREIIERRKNPEKMEEYEARVKVRRALRMAGEDEMATKVQMFDDSKNE